MPPGVATYHRETPVLALEHRPSRPGQGVDAFPPPETPPVNEPHRDPPIDPSGWRAPLGVLTLWALAVAQPVYDILGQGPTFFVYRRWQASDFFLFVAVLSFLLPLVTLLLPAEAARALGRRARMAVYLVEAHLLGTLLLLGGLNQLPSLQRAGSALSLGLATAGSLGIAWLLSRSSGLRTLLGVLSAATLIVPAWFLLRAEIRPLWTPTQVETTQSTVTAPTVVMIVFDALPSGSLLNRHLEVDAARYPNFARLAAESTFYRRTTAAAHVTDLALPALVSGRCALKPGVAPILSRYPVNLFTWLGSGYRLEVQESVTDLCPPDLCVEEAPSFGERFPPLLLDTAVVYAHWIVPSGWSGALPELEGRWGNFVAPRDEPAEDPRPKPDRAKSAQVDRFRSALADMPAGDEPLFFFSHLVFPHEPFIYLPSGRTYRSGYSEPGGNTLVFPEDPWVAHHSYQRHLLQLGFTDLLLGELIDRLQAVGRWHEALVVVTADHGSSYRSGYPRRRLVEENAVDILTVPLFVKKPGPGTGETLDLSAHAVDVVALIAEALGIAPPSALDGRDRAQLEADARMPCRDDSLVDPTEIPPDALRRAVERKVHLFDRDQAGGSWPSVGPRPDLLGVSIREACETSAPFEAGFRGPGAFARVDLGSGFLPAEVIGRVQGIDRDEPVDLAIALNGRIRATTRTYEASASDAARFSAVIPERAFRQGKNQVRIFAATAPGSDCPFAPVLPLRAGPSFLDTPMGVFDVPGVSFRGFHRVDLLRGEEVRWTRPRSRIQIAISEEEAAKVRRLELRIADLRPRTASVRLRVGEEVLFEGPPPTLPWSPIFEVDRVPSPLNLHFDTHAEGDAPATGSLALSGLELGSGD